MSSALEEFHDKWLDGLEFCKLAYQHFELVSAQPNGSEMLRARQRPVKRLIEELLPICSYIQTFYGPGLYLSVRWVNGSQPYDAEVTAVGRMVEHGGWPGLAKLEVTTAQHPNEHLLRELLNAEGGAFGLDGISVERRAGRRVVQSEPTVYTNQSYVDDMCKFAAASIVAKATKMEAGEYEAGTTLIVDCVLPTLFTRDEWELFVSKLRQTVSSHPFEQVFLTTSRPTFTATL
jgi:hypothetical protein